MKRSISGKGLSSHIIDEAAEWFVELNTGEVDSRTRRAFDAWLRKSPESLQAYLEMFPLWDDTELIDSHRTINVDELITLSKAQPISILPRDAGNERTNRSGRPRLLLIAAALCACALVGVLGWYINYSRSTYSTDVGEQRVVALRDGSSIELNSRSRVRVHFTKTRREIDLLEGEALFRVEKDKQRPFVVRSGSTRVRAVGTQFDVYLSKHGTTVTVLEGQVAVLPIDIISPGSATFVSAGEQVTTTSTAVSRATRANLTTATAWRRRSLVFSATPLPEVAEQFNRYNERQLVIRDPKLSRFLVNGSFSSTDPTSLIRFLTAQPDLHVEETDSEIFVDSK